MRAVRVEADLGIRSSISQYTYWDALPLGMRVNDSLDLMANHSCMMRFLLIEKHQDYRHSH